MKPGGLKALVLGMGPAKGPSESGMDDKPMGEESMGDDAGLTAAGEDLIAAVKSGDAAAVGRALKDAHSICQSYDEPDEAAPASEPAEYTKGA